MTIPVYVATVGEARPTPNLELVSASLVSTGFGPTPLTVPASGLPRRMGRSLRQAGKRFAHTPAPLIESWRVAQHLTAATEPRDVIVIGDDAGVGGVLALTESAKPSDQRRQVWTVAGDGLTLRTAQIAGTVGGLDMPEASQIDWEIVQYRFAAEVLATSQLAVEILTAFGVDGHLVTEAFPAVTRSGPDGGELWVPGTVSRANRSGVVMRAAASLPHTRLVVSTRDAPDHIWSGSTWEALRGVRSVLGDRLRRGDRPTGRPSAVVVGDPLSPPDEVTATWRDSGVPLLVPDGSVAAAMWPEAMIWETADELAALMAGKEGRQSAPSDVWTGPSEPDLSDESRARRVSVGVPVFGDVAFLDECLASIVAQDQPAHEVLLIDDGSNSVRVAKALESWAAAEPGLLRTLTQANRGVCVARNSMIDAMTGDAFLLVDQDDVLDPRFISRTAESLRQDASLWAVATWTEFFGEYEGIEAKPPFDRRVGLRENPIVSTGVLVDIKVRDLGVRFAPDLAFLFCEDWHLWSQIVAAGGQMGLVPEPLIRHRVHPASGGFQRTELAQRVGRARAVEPLMAPGIG